MFRACAEVLHGHAAAEAGWPSRQNSATSVSDDDSDGALRPVIRPRAIGLGVNESSCAAAMTRARVSSDTRFLPLIARCDSRNPPVP
jgi:hypothetical protein